MRIPLITTMIDLYEKAGDIVLVQGGQIFLSLSMLIVFAGQLSSCVFVSSSEADDVPSVEIVAAESDVHRNLEASFKTFARHVFYAEEPEVLIVKSSHINAASLGRRRFLLWEGLSELPLPIREGIYAHELAHDELLHSIKVSDLHDLTSFFTEIVGFAGGADFETAATLKHWGTNVILPNYGQGQEFEADAFAIRILRNSGIENPKDQYRRTLRALLELHGDTGGGFFDSHPEISERLSSLEDLN